MTDPERVFRKLIEQGFNAGDLAVADELTADDFVEHQDFGPGHAAGAEGVRAVIASLRRAFPDFRLEIQDLTVAGDTAWARLVATGTHAGPFMGHAPTGRPIRVDVFDVVRVRDGRMVAHWGVPDRLAALMQLGIVGPPAARAA
jgi:steroid delta-isomerase-like uncharacterized protein